MPIVRLQDVGSIGYIADLPPHDLSDVPLAWNSAQNVIFRNGQAERAPGYAAAFDTTPTQASYGLFSATKVDGTKYLIGCGTSKAFDYTGTTENEITGTTVIAATADTKWTGGVLTGFVIVNESTVKPQFIAISNLGSATNLADLTNWPASTTCKVLRPWKYYVVAGNMTESSTQYPYKVRWSNAAVPGTLPTSYTATTTNDAGSVDLSADDGQIIDMLPLGDQLVIYREYGITMMRYVGGTDTVNRLVMAFNRIPAGSSGGMLGNNCGVDVAGIGHVVLSSNDVYVFDGSKVASILDKRWRRALFSTIDATNRKRSFVLNNASDSEAWICYPESAQAACTKALVWNYADNTIGIRDLPNATAGIHAAVNEQSGATWDGLTGDWTTLNATAATWNDFAVAPVTLKTVLASTANKLYVVGNASDAAGSALTAQVQRDYISFGDAQRVKFFRSIWPRFEGDTAQVLGISVGTSMSVDEDPTWQTSMDYTLGSSRKVDVNRSGRFLHLRIRSNTGTVWKIRQLDVDLQVQGLW